MAAKQPLLEAKPLQEIPKSKRGNVLLALEALVGPEVEMRARGLEQLLALDAHRRSPVVAAVMAGRVNEPDLDLRSAIVEALAMALRSSVDGVRTPDNVRQWLRDTLSRMRRREIYSLLQIIASFPKRINSVCSVLDACSFSGDALVRILADRNADVVVRIAAARAIGRIGFLDAKPALERLGHRLANQQTGQKELGVSQDLDREVKDFLSAVIEAIKALEDETG